MKIMSWFDEWAETFEFVQCKPELSFLPMEVSRVQVRARERHKTYRFSFTAARSNIFLPKSIRFNGKLDFK